jgi:MFS family permease
LFFAASSLLEALLPSLISKTAHAAHKGTAMGVYSTSQFLGAFAGGLAGGAAQGVWGHDGVYYTALASILVWFLAAAAMKKPRHLSTYLLKVDDVNESQLLAITGVVEAAIIKEENVAYLKVEKHVLDEEKLLSFAHSENET